MRRISTWLTICLLPALPLRAAEVVGFVSQFGSSLNLNTVITNNDMMAITFNFGNLLDFNGNGLIDEWERGSGGGGIGWA